MVGFGVCDLVASMQPCIVVPAAQAVWQHLLRH